MNDVVVTHVYILQHHLMHISKNRKDILQDVCRSTICNETVLDGFAERERLENKIT